MQRTTPTTTVDLTKAIKANKVLLPTLSRFEALSTIKEAMYIDLANSGIKSGINYCISEGAQSLKDLTCGVYCDDTGRFIYNSQMYITDYNSTASIWLSTKQPVVIKETVHFRYPDLIASAIQNRLVSISILKKTNILLSNAKQCNENYTVTYIDIEFANIPTETVITIDYHPFQDRGLAQRSLDPDAVVLLSNVLSDISNTTAGEIITLMAVDHLSFIGIQVEPLVRQQLQAIAIKLC